MNIILKLNQFAIENVQYMKTRKNIIMENSLFIKLLYSDENFVMNSIYIEFPVKIKEINRNYLFYNFIERDEYIQQLLKIERDIIDYYKIINQCTKTPVYSFKAQMEKGNMKYNYVFPTSSSYTTGGNGNTSAHVSPIIRERIVLKISGIWENSDTLGINYKLLILPTYLHFISNGYTL